MNEAPQKSNQLFLKNSKDLEYVKIYGKRFRSPCFDLVYCLNRQWNDVGIGIIVGRRFGPAVLRNRAKRIFREIARCSQWHIPKGCHLIVYPKSLALRTRHQTLKEAWKMKLRETGLWRLGIKQ